VLKIGRGESAAENPDLVALLTEWGVTPQKDLVLDLSGIGNMFGAGPEIPIILQYEPSPITRPLARVPTAFPVPRSLEIKSGGKSTVEKLFGTTEDSIAVSEVALRAFRLDQISNNHLLTADPALRARIGDVTVGDQIHLEGYLASYSNASGFHRGTSTTRKDTGNGACETVYVTEFDIADPAPRGWRKLQSAALWGMLLSGAAWLLGVGKGWF